MGRMSCHEGSHLQKTHPVCDSAHLQGSCPSGDSVLQRDEVGLHPFLGLSHSACKSKYSGPLDNSVVRIADTICGRKCTYNL